MILVLSCSCLCPIHWSKVVGREWRCSWSSASRKCSNYIGVINNFNAYWDVAYIRSLTCILKFDLENPNIQCHIMAEIKVQGCLMHIVWNSHIPFIPCKSALPFLKYGCFFSVFFVCFFRGCYSFLLSIKIGYTIKYTHHDVFKYLDFDYDLWLWLWLIS